MLQRVLPILATYLAKTLRIKWSGARLPERCVVMFWHGQMFCGWYAARAAATVALVSQSKDGQLLASVLRKWGYRLVRGSSNKKGREALAEAILQLQNGSVDRIVITPDGPRGPYHRFKRGAFFAAKECEVPLYMLQIHYEKPIVFTKSWDRFELPKPFSKCTVQVNPIDLSMMPDDIDAQRVWLDALAAKVGA